MRCTRIISVSGQRCLVLFLTLHGSAGPGGSRAGDSGHPYGDSRCPPDGDSPVPCLFPGRTRGGTCRPCPTSQTVAGAGAAAGGGRLCPSRAHARSAARGQRPRRGGCACSARADVRRPPRGRRAAGGGEQAARARAPPPGPGCDWCRPGPGGPECQAAAEQSCGPSRPPLPGPGAAARRGDPHR